MMASSGPRGKLIELNRRRPKKGKVVSQVCSDGKDLNARAVSQKQCNFSSPSTRGKVILSRNRSNFSGTQFELGPV